MTSSGARPTPTTTDAGCVANPGRDRTWTTSGVTSDVRDFHRSLPGYTPTPVVDLPELAAGLSVAQVVAKDESDRLGLPAFKALGASWAIARTLRTRGNPGRPHTIVTATDGNHGRAVARFARRLGHSADILVPTGIHPTAVQAIRDEAAHVTVIRGSYDDAVQAAADHAAAHDDRLLVQDTAWSGYEEVPGWIVEGYSTIFHELDEQLAELDGRGPQVLVVPTGVGSLLQAALVHHRQVSSPPGTVVVSVEPVVAACVAASIRAGRPASVTTGTTTMAGLNCGTMSSLAWPLIRPGLDAAVTITDRDARSAAGSLASLGVHAGPCGAASLAAVRTIRRHGCTATGSPGPTRPLDLLTPDATVVLLVTEGPDANPS